MPLAAGLAQGDIETSPEEHLRAVAYRLLADLLSTAPDGGRLHAVGHLAGDPSRFGQGLAALAAIARRTEPSLLARQFHDLFIGVGRGELVPYESYYLTGFLQEKPLAKLRRDMARLGIVRDPAVSDPEDHIASVLEIMAGLIDGTFGGSGAAHPASLEEQHAYFVEHVASWAPVLFRDLEAVETSPFYAAVGRVGRTLLEIEARAFAYA